jgi:hypothetical protein
MATRVPIHPLLDEAREIPWDQGLLPRLVENYVFLHAWEESYSQMPCFLFNNNDVVLVVVVDLVDAPCNVVGPKKKKRKRVLIADC